MNDTKTMEELCKSLNILVGILRLDDGCKWTNKFEADLEYCKRLLLGEHSKEDLYKLANSITYVFQGMGSFNDYTPSKYDKSTGRYVRIKGTERFEQITEEIFNLARNLLVDDALGRAPFN